MNKDAILKITVLFSTTDLTTPLYFRGVRWKSEAVVRDFVQRAVIWNVCALGVWLALLFLVSGCGASATSTTAARPGFDLENIESVIGLIQREAMLSGTETPPIPLEVSVGDLATGTILITGLTNVATGTAPIWTIGIDQTEGITTSPPELIFRVSEITSATHVEIPLIVTFGTSSTIVYTVQVTVSSPLISDWLTASSIETYFTGVTFAKQNATPILLANNDIYLMNTDGLTNTVDGIVTLMTHLPAGYTLTGVDELADPDGAGLAAVSYGELGTITLTETANTTNTQTYSMRIRLVAYVSPVVAADIVATYFDGNPVPRSDIEIKGTTITINGVVNTVGSTQVGTVETGSVILTSSSLYTLATDDSAMMPNDPASFTFNNPDGTRATNIVLGTVAVISHGVVSHTVRVIFSSELSQLQLRISSTSLVGGSATISSGEAISVMNSCEVLVPSRIEILGSHQSSAYTTLLPGYYNRSNPAHAPISPSTAFVVTETLALIDSQIDLLVTDEFVVTIEFPPCTIGNVDGTGADEANAFNLDSAPKLELVSYLVNNSNAVQTPNGGGKTYGNSFYKLTAEINLGVPQAPWSELASGSSGEGFVPIGVGGDGEDMTLRFNGTFDCTDKTIARLYIDRLSDYQGLFGYISGGTVKNCSLADVNVTGGSYTGGLVGSATASQIDDSSVTGAVTGSDYVGGLAGALANSSVVSNSDAAATVKSFGFYVGGLVGAVNESSTITNGYATGAVDGNFRTGGLVGTVNDSSTITNSYATGAVDGNHYVGGLVGEANNNSTIADSYATGAVDGNFRTGGLVGEANNNSTIADSYATGAVEGTEYIGGLVGTANASSTITDGYATGTVDGMRSVGGLVGTNDSSTIASSYATGIVTGMFQFIGGLVGRNIEGATISSSYAAGAVTGTSYIGGLVGWNQGLATIVNAYATGAVTGEYLAGGLVGDAGFFSSSISTSYATGSVTRSTGTNTNIGLFIGKNPLIPAGVTNSYWNNEATFTLNGVVSEGRGSGNAEPNAMPPIVTAGLTGLREDQLQVAAPTMTGETYYGWNPPGLDAIAIWNFTTGNYPRLINVPCPNRQHSTETSCDSIP